MKRINQIEGEGKQKILGVVHAGVWIYEIGMKFIREIIPEVKVLTICDDTVQYEFMKQGVVPSDNYIKFLNHAYSLQRSGASLIVFGCSTMNRAKNYIQPFISVPILQIDEPMAEKALEIGKCIGLLATLKTTISSSAKLIEEKAREKGSNVQIKKVLCESAYEALRMGDVEKHDSILLEKIDELSGEVDVIVLAQLSMARLEDKIGKIKVAVLNIGRLGFEKARKLLGLERR